jgi:pyrroline-5-carboxylate reductase
MSGVGPILLVGCGKMGGAMAAGWLAAGRQVVVVEPHAPAPPGVALAVTDAAALPADLTPSAVVLAVKPQEAARVLPSYARFAGASVFVSIMAGKTVANMQALLGAAARVVRAMPNTPAAIGRGITVCCAGAGVSEAQRALADSLLAAVGQVEWVNDESLIDPVTAVSGGGPAYVFLLVEMLAQAAVAEGIPEPLAQRLARATVAGSGALLDASAEVPAATLRQNVTSPGGTTAEALKVLMDDAAWPALMRRAIAAATARSRALSA